MINNLFQHLNLIIPQNSNKCHLIPTLTLNPNPTTPTNCPATSQQPSNTGQQPHQVAPPKPTNYAHAAYCQSCGHLYLLTLI